MIAPAGSRKKSRSHKMWSGKVELGERVVSDTEDTRFGCPSPCGLPHRRIRKRKPSKPGPAGP